MPTPAVVDAPVRVVRIEVRPRAEEADAAGDALRREAASLGRRPPVRAEHARVYLVEGPLDDPRLRRLAEELLVDPVTQEATIGAAPPRGDAVVEIHPLPGVMDPDAAAVELAAEAMLGVPVRVQTGRRFDLAGVTPDEAKAIAEATLANPVIHAVHLEPFLPNALPRGTEYELSIVEVPIRDLSDELLERLSREGHLFLSLEEMRAIQAHYRDLGREPREIELETLAQTWSEHCVHKTLKATVNYREAIPDDLPPNARGALRLVERMADRPGHERHDDGSITIHNLLKSTVAAATNELIEEGVDWCLSVFVDNAGIVAFDEDTAVCFKVETHNHPSAIEPYGGAATGIGGCIRDIIGTGLAARPIAATDVFCVAHPESFTAERHALPRKGAEGTKPLPAGVLHPRRILSQVVAGVRDYGNRMGIPTLNGAVWFHDDYVGNPLVFCGCVGVMPRDKIRGEPRAGDRIVALGGRTGRDGIHGATFSSAELTDTHADEFSHAVQIGNAVTEKQVLDAILAARDHEDGCLFHAITDCGAGGFSSAVGEMGETLGAAVNLERAPLKYSGLSPTEIWISEAQERMVLAVPAENIDALAKICALHGVEMADLGRFGTADRELILRYHGTEVGRMSMEFLHEGLPRTTREAVWEGRETGGDGLESRATERDEVADILLRLLAHPNIASKRWIVRQYDHEVQGRSVVTPFAGAGGIGPSDAAVILPVRSSKRGLAIANGLATGLHEDPYLMAHAAIDECVRNLVCVGADPDRVAILDNFCWPGCGHPRNLASLVRAAEGCYDAAKAYRTPFISGKDSLNNQFTTESGRTIAIPPTLLISGFGPVEHIEACVTMDAKAAGNRLLLLGPVGGQLGGSHLEMLLGPSGHALPETDLDLGPRAARAVHRLIREGLVRSAHDVSDGGLLVAATEMLIASGFGLDLEVTLSPDELFNEAPSRYLLEIEPDDVPRAQAIVNEEADRIPITLLGTFTDSGRLRAGTELDLAVDNLARAWTSPLDWS